jgi:hypothetical protein
MYGSEVIKRNYRLMLTNYFKLFYNEGTLEEQVERARTQAQQP